MQTDVNTVTHVINACDCLTRARDILRFMIEAHIRNRDNDPGIGWILETVETGIPANQRGTHKSTPTKPAASEITDAAGFLLAHLLIVSRSVVHGVRFRLLAMFSAIPRPQKNPLSQRVGWSTNLILRYKYV